MIDDRPQQTEFPSAWAQGAPAAARWRDQSPLHRFLGGSPGAVLAKLVVLSLIVGAILMWLDIRPVDVFRMLSEAVNHLYDLGFDAVRQFGTYIGAGAAIVIPIWLVMRVLSYRSPR